MGSTLRLAVLIAAVCAAVPAAGAGRHHPHHQAHKSGHRPPAHRVAPPPDVLRFSDAGLEPTRWADLAGWDVDDHTAAYGTFLASCRPIVRARKAPPPEKRVMFNALQTVCRQAIAAGRLDSAAARSFFEANFRPVLISKLGDAAGFLTGYYEPVIDGSRFPSPEFHTPIYRRPPDLAHERKLRKGEGFPNNGVVGRYNDKNEFVPYYDRAAIENGVFDGQHLEICWVRDPVEAFFMQIQGSGRVRLEDGTILRLNYDAHNGQPYMAIGRVLIDRGLVPREQMSMDRIRKWMAENPDQAVELRQNNKSFVFFRIIGLSGDQEAVGAQGIPLTSGRSIAVDRNLHVYGTPFFVQADLPIDSEHPETKFQRLMIGQDTGSAIIGPARADVFFGAGDEAGRIAGRLRHPGRFAMLVPKEIDPALASRGVPLPLPGPEPRIVVASPSSATSGSAGTPRATRVADSTVPLPPPRPPVLPHPVRARSTPGPVNLTPSP